jgi:hypothetical protein
MASQEPSAVCIIVAPVKAWVARSPSVSRAKASTLRSFPDRIHTLHNRIG